MALFTKSYISNMSEFNISTIPSEQQRYLNWFIINEDIERRSEPVFIFDILLLCNLKDL